ncbi:hypothetical protein J8273_5146 [Carpediemonas membranifera]|uniref:Uncharacterized protein n=1 Tax=Carpediemonas membranifera TaxID=201153 RepID=A0A8J6ATP9_9EUKA|nr:hypothetical protein J8273_5146 [Carpediemonas membranifera]|eukprot:KAG9392165.1 hypothetical protein J8273_5146 [Carpediemonas membranifera]
MDSDVCDIWPCHVTTRPPASVIWELTSVDDSAKRTESSAESKQMTRCSRILRAGKARSGVQLSARRISATNFWEHISDNGWAETIDRSLRMRLSHPVATNASLQDDTPKCLVHSRSHQSLLTNCRFHTQWYGGISFPFLRCLRCPLCFLGSVFQMKSHSKLDLIYIAHYTAEGCSCVELRYLGKVLQRQVGCGSVGLVGFHCLAHKGFC